MKTYFIRPTLYPMFRLAGVLALALALVACGRGSDEAEATATPVAEAATPAAETPASAETGGDAATTPVPEAATSAEDVSVPPPDVIDTGAAGDIEPQARDAMYSAAPEMTIDPSRFYYATFKTERGDIKVQLFADRAPVTVNNFVYLAREGFFDNTTFHRVLEDFMAQGGDPTGTGRGGPGYQFEDEFYPGLVFDRPGLLAMANSGPGTNGSQFFITYAATDWLNGGHTIFGELIEGNEVMDRLTRRDPSQPVSFDGDLLYTVVIEESDASILPSPTPAPPTATPTSTPTPFAPTSLDATDRPLAALTATERIDYFNIAPEIVIDTAKDYTATITTAKGDLVVTLYDDQAPTAVNNFVVLANLGFYDNSTIAQVIEGDALVFGAPDNSAANDVGYSFVGETGVITETDLGSMSYIPVDQLDDGTLLSNGSQIFIALVQPSADVSAFYSFFGKVVGGVELLPQLSTNDTIEMITITESE